MLMYGVWFIGTEDQPAGICWQYRKPFLADTEIEAALFREEMQQISLTLMLQVYIRFARLKFWSELKIFSIKYLQNSEIVVKWFCWLG